MRLHHLEATAFGPFTDTVTVDLDRLSEAGLFLLTGATGAGKTSVLDAICFALYGDVPGDRSTAKRLRSDQAPADVPTRVVLEATLGGRRLRIARSPAWERPKRRGTGTTTQQAAVTVLEQRGEEWVLLTNRLDEAGHLVSELLGMTQTQFTQVAMLPQGRFWAFLRATTEERKRLLERLFRTERFTDVERWLRDHRVELRRRADELHQEIAAVVSRVSETASEPLPEAWDVHDLSLPAGDGEVEEWAKALVERSSQAQAEASGAAMVALAAEAEALTALDGARRLALAQERLRKAHAEHTALLDAADEHDARVAALDAARRAAPVVPLHRQSAAASAAHETAAARAAEVAEVAEGLTLDAARARHQEATTALAEARALLPVQEQADRLAQRLRAATADRERVVGEVAALAEAAEELPERLQTLRASLEETRAATLAHPALRERVRALDTIARLTPELDRARVAHAEAKAAAVEARSRFLDVRQARLDGIAAELAGDLAVGQDCPVCGSHEHPRKAAPGEGAPDAADEKAAQIAYDDAAAEEHARAGNVRDLETRLELAHTAAGEVDDEAGLREELDRTAGLAAREPRLAEEVSVAEAERDRITQRHGAATTRLRELEATLTHLSAEREEAVQRIDAVRGGHPTLRDLVARHEDVQRSAERAMRALEEVARTAEALDAARRAVDEAARQAGFPEADAALAAALPQAEIDRLAAEVRSHEDRLAAARAALAEPGAEETLARPAPDLDALARSHRAAAAAADTAQSTADATATRAARLDTLGRRLRQALARWAPVRAELEVAVRLASFAEGKSADNRLQMSLSAYVVAYRLTQVVAAANERLAVMSDRRYTLEHSAARAAGDRRGGLALVVRDDWSGEARDPATLSGGETFLVSLALALGLADVIMHEAGGAMLETLFVDEGFGSLDADTLDDVLDMLDTLREGGRVVGVVSHVSEMRDRIPTQLSVNKGRSGSTLSITAA